MASRCITHCTYDPIFLSFSSFRRSSLSGPNQDTNTRSNPISTSENDVARGARSAAEMQRIHLGYFTRGPNEHRWKPFWHSIILVDRDRFHGLSKSIYLGSPIPFVQRIIRVFVTAQTFKLGSQKFKTWNTKPIIPITMCNFMGLAKPTLPPLHHHCK